MSAACASPGGEPALPPTTQTNERVSPRGAIRRPAARSDTIFVIRPQRAGAAAGEDATSSHRARPTAITTQLKSPELYHEWRMNGPQTPRAFRGRILRQLCAMVPFTRPVR